MNSRLIGAVVAIIVVVAIAGVAVAALGGAKSTTTTTSSSASSTTTIPTTTSSVVSTTTTSSSTSSTTITSTSMALSIEIQSSSSLGSYLTNGTGWTLYLFTKDTPNSGLSTCYVGCSNFWSPFLGNASDLVLPSGLNASAFGTITRTGGGTQITYEGWPLYYYSGDTVAGQTNGQGKQGTWFVVNYPTISISTSSLSTRTASSVPTTTSTSTSVVSTTTSPTTTTSSTTSVTTKTTS